MREIRVYHSGDIQVGASLELDDTAANHVGRVLRARVGDPLTLFNGDGNNYHTTIEAVGKRDVVVTVENCVSADNESPLHTILGLGLSKGERFDWAIQKATEMGVSQIVPLITERVDVKLPADRMEKKIRHWQQIVISACEQCGRAVVPEVLAPMHLLSWLESAKADKKLVLHPDKSATLGQGSPKSIALLIGPEGGLSEAEVSMAASLSFERLQLGPRVLRTETAPAVALAVLGSAFGDI